MTSRLSHPVSSSERFIVDRPSLVEVCFATGLFVFLLVLKILYAFHYRIDSDEPQHLHVVWGWTQHTIPYRDYFDNHSPLFQLLCAPFFTALGVRADIIVPMRLLVIPLFALCLYCIGRIVGILVSPRAGLWSAVFVAVMPRFFFVTTEFRPDDLWATLWLALLFVAISGAMTLRRAFFVGILLGTSFCVSAKTLLLLVAMALATIILLIFQSRMCKTISWMRLLQFSFAIAGGALILPTAFSLFFWWQGALGQMVYCIITHNVLPASNASALDLVKPLKWVGFAAVPVGVGVGLYFLRLSAEGTKKTQALWLLCVASFLYATLKAYWPVLTQEDYVVSDPLMMGMLAAVVVSVPHIWPRLFSPLRLILPVSIALLMLGLILKTDSPLQDETEDKISTIATALQLTRPSDYIMDSKGETVYRRRPFYYVLEGLTGKRMKAGLISETIPERLVETETPLATLRRMPPVAAEFIRKNYLPIAFRLSVLGQILSGNDDQFAFDIAVPSVYTVITEFGSFKGTLDGKSISGPVRIEPGAHEIRRTSGSGRLALLWARAAEKGYNPFSPVEPDRWTAQD